jgi:hypothetical protein
MKYNTILALALGFVLLFLVVMGAIIGYWSRQQEINILWNKIHVLEQSP